MSLDPGQIAAWVARNAALLEEAADEDAKAFHRLSGPERWSRIEAACRAAAAISAESPAAAAREAEVARDHARWNALIDSLRSHDRR